jgi:hypothetical protein
MSRARVIGGGSVLMTAAAITWCAWSVSRPLRLPWPARSTAPRVGVTVEAVVVPDSAVAAAIHAAGFRPTRSLAPMTFEPSTVGLQSPPPLPKPSLALVGVVLGRSRTLLLTGVPGSPGARLLTQGDTAGGLRVRSISSAGRVIITGYDTVWTFRPPEEQK